MRITATIIAGICTAVLSACQLGLVNNSNSESPQPVVKGHTSKLTGKNLGSMGHAVDKWFTANEKWSWANVDGKELKKLRDDLNTFFDTKGNRYELKTFRYTDNRKSVEYCLVGHDKYGQIYAARTAKVNLNATKTNTSNQVGSEKTPITYQYDKLPQLCRWK